MAYPSSFSSDFQSYAPIIQRLVNYRGPQDPLKGDSLNVEVREAAKSAIKAIFENATVAPTSQKKIGKAEGFGSEAVPSSRGGITRNYFKFYPCNTWLW